MPQFVQYINKLDFELTHHRVYLEGLDRYWQGWATCWLYRQMQD